LKNNERSLYYLRMIEWYRTALPARTDIRILAADVI
jgi:hypothetical protein